MVNRRFLLTMIMSVFAHSVSTDVDTCIYTINQAVSLDGLLSEDDNVNTTDNGPGEVRFGTHYTRWGNCDCQSPAEVLYVGYTAKSYYNNGGGVDYQCLPSSPEFADGAASGFQSKSYIYGVEYEQHNSPVVPGDRHDRSVPCAVCHVHGKRETLMIPAKVACPGNWTKEYEGYLMAQHHTHTGSYYICVDKQMKKLQGGEGNQNGGLVYVVESVCGSLPCPPYEDGSEMACVVCTL